MFRLEDPFSSFRFVIQLDGIITAGFSKISGLSAKMEFDTVQEGGVDYEYKLPSKMSYGEITLERGLIGVDLSFHLWLVAMMEGVCIRQSGCIMVLNRLSLPSIIWRFTDAFPTSWELSDLDAIDGGILTETIVLAHHGLTKIFTSPNLPI